MKREFLLLMCVMWCVGVRLTPLENNDKLQDVTNLYVAEWQWESWPVKQELSEKEGKSPGLRKNVALWGDSSKSAWYLFGGQPINGNPKKVYSDVWKFVVKTRVWKRFFPSQGNVEAAFGSKKGGTTLRGNVTDGINASYFEPITHSVVLCGKLQQNISKKTKNLNEWTSLRRKKIEEDKIDEISSLAIYAPKITESNTVWQIDVKEKIWTTYVCFSKDNIKNSTKPFTNKIKAMIKTTQNNSQATKNFTETKINTEEYIDKEPKQYQNMDNKKKKINQVKKINEKPQQKKPIIENRGTIRKKRNINETTNDFEQKTNRNENDTKVNDSKVGGNTEKPISSSEPEKLLTEKSQNPKRDTKYCPEFSDASQSVTWCDGKNEALVTADVITSDIRVWVFNLSTSHWFQMQIKITDGIQWPGCPNINSIRYVGNEEEVYIICSQSVKKINESNSFQNSTNTSKTPSDFNTKLVFQINYKEGVLRSLGKIQLNPYFNSPEGEKVWRNESKSILQLIKNSDNNTILILAYLDAIDLWILNKDQKGFDLIEKIWRGSALKWFDKYNAALYSLQFVTESGNSETILLPNPRNIQLSEYWPRERGRFIIRVFKNENLKNQSFENRTREQNLTYELLQSDYKPSEAEHQLNHIYSLKVLVFFGISLTIFTVFGLVVFLKKCVNCPPKIRVRSDCHKSPVVVRYSVIPDNLLYPVA